MNKLLIVILAIILIFVSSFRIKVQDDAKDQEEFAMACVACAFGADTHAKTQDSCATLKPLCDEYEAHLKAHSKA